MHLPIRVVGRSQPVEVTFRLFTSFKFAVHVPMRGVVEFVADLSGGNALTARVLQVEEPSRTVNDADALWKALETARSILSAVLSRLGLVELDGERHAYWGIGTRHLHSVGVAHLNEQAARMACQTALEGLTPVWRDRTEPAPKVHGAADILDSYYQQAQDEVLGEWERKAEREAEEYLTGRASGAHSEVAP